MDLYNRLLLVWPSPVVRLNRAVAISKVEGAEVALALVDELESEGFLDLYHYLPATKTYLLEELGRFEEAELFRARARDSAANEVELALFSGRRPRQVLKVDAEGRLVTLTPNQRGVVNVRTAEIPTRVRRSSVNVASQIDPSDYTASAYPSEWTVADTFSPTWVRVASLAPAGS